MAEWEYVGVSKERYNGLKFWELVHLPKSSKPAIVDLALMKYGIPTLTDDELMRQLKERGIEISQ